MRDQRISMNHQESPAPNERGFALMGFIVVILGLGVLIAISAVRSSQDRATRVQTEAMDDLEQIGEALVAYASVHNRLPCPAAVDKTGEEDRSGVSCDAPEGLVPWRTLGLKEDLALDRWGRYVFYRVELSLAELDVAANESITKAFGGAAGDGLIVCRTDDDPCDTEAAQVVGDKHTSVDRPGGAFALISTGPSGGGGFPRGNTDSSPPKEAGGVEEKLNVGTGGTYYSLPFTIRDADGEALDPSSDDYFDDIVYTMNVQTLMERAGLLPSAMPSLLSDPGKFKTTENTYGNHRKPGFKTPPHADWATTDDVLFFGGGSDDEDTYDPSDADDDRSSCAWYNEPFDLTTETLRGFLRIQFMPGEAYDDEDQGTSQGAALIVVPGQRDMGADDCGVPYHTNTSGFKGIPPPKFGLEFDIYWDAQYEQPDHSVRSNPSPTGNHVALLNPDANDYILHGFDVAGNPDCNPRHGMPAMNGAEGGCTYPSGDVTQRPDRHKVPRPANWLEDGQYYDPALSSNAGQPYAVRFEMRRCNADCSQCGADTAPVDPAVPDVKDWKAIHFKAWIMCDEIGGGANCPAMPSGFDAAGRFTDTTDYMVNACLPDRSLNYPEESFDTVKLGIGFSSRFTATALLIHRFEALSSD